MIAFPPPKGRVSYGLSLASTLFKGNPFKWNCALHLAPHTLHPRARPAPRTQHPSLKFAKELVVQKKNKKPRGCLSRLLQIHRQPPQPPPPPKCCRICANGQFLLSLAQKPLVPELRKEDVGPGYAFKFAAFAHFTSGDTVDRFATGD